MSKEKKRDCLKRGEQISEGGGGEDVRESGAMSQNISEWSQNFRLEKIPNGPVNILIYQLARPQPGTDAGAEPCSPPQQSLL